MHYSFMNYAYDVDCMLSEVQLTSSIKCDFLGVFMTNFMIELSVRNITSTNIYRWSTI